MCHACGLGQQIKDMYALLKAVIPEFWLTLAPELPRLRQEQTATALGTGANHLHVPPPMVGRVDSYVPGQVSEERSALRTVDAFRKAVQMSGENVTTQAVYDHMMTFVSSTEDMPSFHAIQCRVSRLACQNATGKRKHPDQNVDEITMVATPGPVRGDETAGTNTLPSSQSVTGSSSRGTTAPCDIPTLMDEALGKIKSAEPLRNPMAREVCNAMTQLNPKAEFTYNMVNKRLGRLRSKSS